MVCKIVDRRRSPQWFQVCYGKWLRGARRAFVAYICVVESGNGEESYEKREKNSRCSLGEHRALQNMMSGEQKGGARTMNGSRREHVYVASTHDISRIPTKPSPQSLYLHPTPPHPWSVLGNILLPPLLYSRRPWLGAYKALNMRTNLKYSTVSATVF